MSRTFPYKYKWKELEMTAQNHIKPSSHWFDSFKFSHRNTAMKRYQIMIIMITNSSYV